MTPAEQGSMLIHLTRNDLSPGDIISPGNWGSILRQWGPAHPLWNREEVLERIRVAEFAGKPSRFDAAFAFTELNAALWWWRHERQSDFGYEVAIVDAQAPVHEGDFLGVQMIAGVDASPEEAARRYWSRGRPRFNSPDGVFIDEIVTSSALRVLEKIPRPDFGP
jgi:hypothetical protein